MVGGTHADALYGALREAVNHQILLPEVVAGEERAQSAGPAGDEHGPVRVEGGLLAGHGGCGAGQPRRQQPRPAHGELRLAGGEHSRPVD